MQIADEHSLDGNSVSIEAQMMKVSTNAADYALITAIYKQNSQHDQNRAGRRVGRLNARR